MTASKLVLNAASGASGDPLNIENVFSTFTYYGNGGTGQSIVNGIDLSGEGGLVWFKQRNATRDHGLFDTARGATKYVVANETNGEATSGTTLTAFNSNGFTLGGGGGIVNNGSGEYVSWTFRKAKKFFDIVTYTGSGSHPRNVSHNLGSVPGMILVKNLSDGTEDWIVYHRGVDSSAPEDYGMFLNLTDAAVNNDAYWGDTAPTSTNFTVGGNITNQSGQNFIAYLFAHNNNDGDFGPDGDKDIIKCGGYTGNGASGLGTFQDLGFEPQWIMVKNTDLSSEGWVMLDNMRGVSGPGSNDPRVTANSNNQEYNGAIMQFSATGFTPVSADDKINGSGHAYIYMAIRRGPMATPEDATKVFAIGERGQNSPPPAYQAGFAPDFFTNRSDVTATTQWYTYDRLRGRVETLFLDSTSAEQAYGGTAYAFDQMDGIGQATNSDVNNLSWMWKRAPGYFDVVGYTGTGSNRTVSHNLGVAPEMIWVKGRSQAENWAVYHKDTGATKFLRLNTTMAATTASNRWNDTAPTSSVFTVGTDNEVNMSGQTFIAYLFATVAGVSKVGSYTGNGSSQNIDCGFSSGARFVLIKKTDSTQDWVVFDSQRGIVAGNDPWLGLNNTDAETNGYDAVDPYSAGFSVGPDVPGIVNANGSSFIFYAIA